MNKLAVWGFSRVPPFAQGPLHNQVSGYARNTPIAA